MKYQPAAVVQQNVGTVQEPFFGGEFGVYLTTVQALQIGTITFTAAGTATYTANAAVTLATPNDLQLTALVAIQALPTDPPVGVQLMGVSDASANITGTVFFNPPTWSTNLDPNFGRGIAFDLNPSVPGAKFKSITGLGAVTGGQFGLKIGVFSLPQQSDYVFIGCTTEIDFNAKDRMAKGVDCRMETDAFIKAGKTQAGELKIGSKLFSMVEGMARFSGLKATAMLVGVKDGILIGDQLVFTAYRPTIKARLPDGDGESMSDAEGKFEEHLFFVAPGM